MNAGWILAGVVLWVVGLSLLMDADRVGTPIVIQKWTRRGASVSGGIAILLAIAEGSNNLGGWLLIALLMACAGSVIGGLYGRYKYKQAVDGLERIERAKETGETVYIPTIKTYIDEWILRRSQNAFATIVAISTMVITAALAANGGDPIQGAFVAGFFAYLAAAWYYKRIFIRYESFAPPPTAPSPPAPQPKSTTEDLNRQDPRDAFDIPPQRLDE